MKTRGRGLWKLAAVVPVLATAAFGGWWGTHLSHTHASAFAGFQIISGDAQTTSGSISRDQAVAIVVNKLSEMDPNVNWNLDVPSASAQEFAQLTQIADAIGTIRYQRTAAIDAWVVQIHENGSGGLPASAIGIVSNNVGGALCGKVGGTGVCDPPGTLLNVQIQTPATQGCRLGC